MYIIEPFLIKTERRLKNFEKVEGPRNLAGKDIQRIHSLLAEGKKKGTVLIDFTPFSNLGTESRYEKMKKWDWKGAYVVVRDGPLVGEFKKNGIPMLIDDKRSKVTQSFSTLENMTKVNYANLHGKYVEKKLLKLLNKNIRKPQRKVDWIKLKDGEGVNMWFDIKGVIEDPKNLLFIGYQLGYLLTDAYSTYIKEDGFIVSNNNAWALASLLATRFEKELYIVDRLGPSPRVNIKWLQEIGYNINGKRLIIVEDLISTGREVDLLYFFLDYIGVEVRRIISLFDLQKAGPILNGSSGKKLTLLSLCRPLPKISGYKQIPKYEYNNMKRRKN